jgi:hypothetical protein
VKNKYYHYLALDGVVIRVKEKRRPSEKTIPINGTWVLREYAGGTWTMPCFPEVTFGMLKSLNYLGCVEEGAA